MNLKTINERVHKEVMGLVWNENYCRVCGWPIGKGCTKDDCSMRPIPTRRADEPPNYIGDFNKTIEVIDELCSKGLKVEFNFNKGKCVITKQNGVQVISESEHFGLGVCIAALEAVTVKDNEVRCIITIFT